MNMDTLLSSEKKVDVVVFSADKWEYFKLWIVNLFLSVATLGVYSAWAKVRNTQYLYGHTQVHQHRFHYLAQPKQILKGRLLALIILWAYMILLYTMPIAGLVFSGVLALLSPVLIVQGLRFNLRHTAYRNVRFGFTGSYAKAYLNFLILPVLGILTLGLALPWIYCRIDQYIYNNIRFGEREVQVSITSGTYYKAALMTVFAYLVPMIAMFIFLFRDNQVERSEQVLLTYISYVFAFLAYAIYRVITRNYIFNNLQSLDLAEFRSNLGVKSYLWLELSNLVLLVCSLGLAFPITQIRKRALLASVTEVHLSSEIDRLTSSSSELDSALGEEVAGFFDADFSMT